MINLQTNVIYLRLHQHREHGSKNARMKVIAKTAAIMKPGRMVVIIGGSREVSYGV